MVYVYLSDQSVHVVKSNEVPRESHGEHIGSWLQVLQELNKWRTVTEPNQVALPISVTDLLSLGTTVGHLKENSPTTLSVSSLLTVLKEQIGTSKVVLVPSPDDEIEPEPEVTVWEDPILHSIFNAVDEDE